MIEIILGLIILNMIIMAVTVVHIRGVLAAQERYIAESLGLGRWQNHDEHKKAYRRATAQAQDAEDVELKVYSPSHDPDTVMRGGVVDVFN